MSMEMTPVAEPVDVGVLRWQAEGTPQLHSGFQAAAQELLQVQHAFGLRFRIRRLLQNPMESQGSRADQKLAGRRMAATDARRGGLLTSEDLAVVNRTLLKGEKWETANERLVWI